MLFARLLAGNLTLALCSGSCRTLATQQRCLTPLQPDPAAVTILWYM